MRYIIKIIIILFLLLTLLFVHVYANQATSADDTNITKIFQDARKLFYEKDWKGAIKKFKKIAENFSESKWADDSLYWLAYSMNQMSQRYDNLNNSLSLKEDAIEKLSTLINQYPDSKWIKASRILTVEIAEELVNRGLKEYKKYITDPIQTDEEADIKIIAITALLNTDKDKAFPILERIIQNDKNPRLRKKAVFVLSQLADARVVPKLVAIALKDKDTNVKKEAIFWLGQVKSQESIKKLREIYNKISNLELKRRTVYSISQAGGDSAVKELIHIYKRENNLELKKQIIFWLGNMRNKAAQNFILEILER